MKLNLSAKEFIALYTALASRPATLIDSDSEPLKQLRDRMKAFLIGSLTRPDDVDDPKFVAWKEWEDTQKKKIAELERSSNTITDDDSSLTKEMLIISDDELDSQGTYPRKQPPTPHMPKHSGKNHGKRR
jgi:hypothetical protein